MKNYIKILPLLVIILGVLAVLYMVHACQNESTTPPPVDSTSVPIPPVYSDGETISIKTVSSASILKKDIKTIEGEKTRAGKSKVASVSCCTDHQVANQCCCDSVLSKYVWLKTNRKDSVFNFKNTDPYFISCKEQFTNFVRQQEKIDSLFKKHK